MKPLIVGIVALVYLALISSAVGRSRTGWAEGYPDAGLWWGVISAFLTIALLAVVIGSWITHRAARRPDA
jgi:uncharacterized membrane protein